MSNSLKRIVVLSGGAMGSLFGSLIQSSLNEASSSVQIVIRANWPDHLDTIRRNGLKVDARSPETQEIWKSLVVKNQIPVENGEYVVPLEVKSDDELNEQYSHSFDYALIIDKSRNTMEVSNLAKSLLKTDGKACSIQNGMGNVEMIQSVLGSDRVFQGVTSHASQLKCAGHIQHNGIGFTTISPIVQSLEQDAKWMMDLLESCHISCALLDSTPFNELLWTKLAVNACINPLTAMYDVPNGLLLKSASLIHLMDSILDEICLAAKSNGVHLEKEKTMERVVTVATQTQNNVSSMLSDVRNHFPTEIDFINGYVVHTAKKLGVPIPLNSSLVDQIKQIEKGYLS